MNKFRNERWLFRAKVLKLTMEKTKVMVRKGITNDDQYKSIIYLCGICSFYIEATQFCMHNVVSRSTEDVLE